MTLPTLVTPEFRAKIPSTGEEIKYRPFLVKEEKILLMAMESGELQDLVDATKQILENCILSDVKIDDLASFDIEYIFLKLRSKSVGEEIELSLKHQENTECDNITNITINVDDIEVTKIDPKSKIIMLNDTLGLKMRYPSINHVMIDADKPNDIESLLHLISLCIECVFEEDTIYDDFSLDELKDFINNFSTTQLEKITKFIENMPKLRKEISFTCKKCKKKEKIVLEGLMNFFT